MKKTKFLFDVPVTKDWLFWVWIFILVGGVISSLQRVMNSGGLSTTPLGILSGTIDAAVVILSSFIWIVLIYFIRKFVRKKSSNPNIEVALDTSAVDTLMPQNRRKFFTTIPGIILILIVVSVISIVAIENSRSKDFGAEFLSKQQKISRIIGEWNVAVAPVAQAIQSISAGTMDLTEATTIMTVANSNMSDIDYRLRLACQILPVRRVDGSEKELAIDMAYEMLREACTVTPQQYMEVIALVKEQLSPQATQERIDYHVNQYALLGNRKKIAAVNGLNALMPYVSSAEKEQLNRMKELFGQLSNP